MTQWRRQPTCCWEMCYGPEGTLLVTELCRATGAAPRTATVRSPFFEPLTTSVLPRSFPFPPQPLKSLRKLKKCSPSLCMGLLSADSTAPVSIRVCSRCWPSKEWWENRHGGERPWESRKLLSSTSCSPGELGEPGPGATLCQAVHS